MSTGIEPIELSLTSRRWHLDDVTLGQRIKAARERLGIGVNELDRAVGTRPGYMSRVENDDFGSIGSDKLARLGEVLGVSLDWIVRGVGTLDEALAKEGARICQRVGWSDAVREARRRHPSIEEKYWDMVGDLAGPGLPQRIDVAFVVGLARQLADAHEAASQTSTPKKKK